MNYFRRFFNKYFVIGLITILISIILDLIMKDNFIKNILVNLFNTIGIALLIGSIFDFSKNSNDFMNFVSSILKDIIVSKNFLMGLEDKEKKKALEMVLTPSGNQLEQCSDIQMYFKKKIEDTMEIFHTNFKTNLVVNVDVEKKNNIVQTTIILTYRVYKIEDKYFPLITTFDRQGCNVEKSFIIYSAGVKEITEKESEQLPEVGISPTNLKMYSYEIPEELYKYPYLTIKKIVIEKGYDHWTNFHWNTLTPADGITFTLQCHDGLHVQEYFISDSEEKYIVTKNTDETRIDIFSSVWLDKHSGFVFTISDTK